MNALLLSCLVLGAQTAYGDFPVLNDMKDLRCEPQHWENEQDSTKWNEGTNKWNVKDWNAGQGTSANHVGFPENLKDQKTKIVDAFINLPDKRGPDAAVLCDVRIVGADIEAFWVTQSGEHQEEIESFAIGDADGNKQHVRFGIKAAQDNPGPYARLEVYGNQRPSSAVVTCGAGQTGQSCDGLKFEIRNQADNAGK